MILYFFFYNLIILFYKIETKVVGKAKVLLFKSDFFKHLSLINLVYNISVF